MGIIRVSAAILNRITVDGQILLALNKNRLKKGERVFTPFGGAIEFHEPARVFLSGLGARLEKGNDLRFTVDAGKLAEFERWFLSRTGREISPLRELQEELVEEEGVLTGLEPEQVFSSYLWTAKPRQEKTTRAGQEGMLTQRYIEVFYVGFYDSSLYSQIIAKLDAPGSRLAIVSEEEIRAGFTRLGTNIGSNCMDLLGQDIID